MERVRAAVKLNGIGDTDDGTCPRNSNRSSRATRSGSTTSRGRSTCCCTSSSGTRSTSTTSRSPLITKQYLEYIDLMQELNLDVAGEFLVMAATLIHIKSRMLLPRPDPAQEDPEEDPREALVRRLLEHQKFKAAAELLHERETLRSAQWTRPDGPIARDCRRSAGAGSRSRSLQPDQRVPHRRRARQAAAEGLPAGRADPDRGSHRAADGAAVGDRGAAASRTCSPTSSRAPG